MADQDLTRIPAARVPITDDRTGIMSRDWYRFFFNLFTLTGSGEQTDSWGAPLAPAYTPQLSDSRYASFYDTTTQTAAAINTAYGVTFNSTALSMGVYVGSPTSRLYVDRPGVYNFQFSAQLNKASASAKNVYIWYRLNGSDAPYSATKVTLAGSSSATVAAWNFVLEMAAGDYFELMWSTDDTGCVIQASASSSPAPGIPSVIMTVTDNIKS